MSNKTRKWLRGGIEVLIHGGTSALIASFVAWKVGTPIWSSTFWTSVEAQFFGNGMVRFLQWWNNNPLPPTDDSNPPFVGEPQKISLNPLAKVQPKDKDAA